MELKINIYIYICQREDRAFFKQFVSYVLFEPFAFGQCSLICNSWHCDGDLKRCSLWTFIFLCGVGQDGA